uniref:Uncharacterized protein n=1 Tax=Helianthus annuus TaxID=4232 RepID=A0A251VFR8_HELAN
MLCNHLKVVKLSSMLCNYLKVVMLKQNPKNAFTTPYIIPLCLNIIISCLIFIFFS